MHKTFSDEFKIALLAIGLAAGSFFLQGDYGLNLLDEGFLWYGAIQTHLGHLPLRDFQSYDPGRYYCISFFFSFLGDGFKALRLSMASLQAAALFFGLWAARSVVRRWTSLVAFGFVLILWMIIPFRSLEYFLPMTAVFFGMRVAEKPSRMRHFISGLFVGVAFFFGINHGVYALLAFYLLIVLAFLKGNRKYFAGKQAAFFGGIFIGYLPMLFLLLFAPGFLEAYRNSILRSTQYINHFSLPVPWPWLVNWENICHALPAGYPRVLEWLNKVSIGIFFLAIPLFYLLCGFFLLGRPKPLSETPLLAACVCVGSAYLCHIFSRADMCHLAEGSAPFLVGLLALIFFFKKKRQAKFITALASFFFLLSFTSAGLLDPFCFKYFAPKEAMALCALGSDKAWMTRIDAVKIEHIQKTVSQHVRRDENILILNWPAFYCLLHKTSPIYETYCLYPASQESQKISIRALEDKKVNWVLFNRDYDTYFQYTDALLWKYLKENFKALPVEDKYLNYWLLHRKVA